MEHLSVATRKDANLSYVNLRRRFRANVELTRYFKEYSVVMPQRRVVLESPYSGNVARNVKYAKECLHDSLLRNEAPIASHLLFTQPGILDDNKPLERNMGMEAGWAWIGVADALVVYEDYGISPGMQRGIEIATKLGVVVELRKIGK
jgi:hypothetical protein